MSFRNTCWFLGIGVGGAIGAAVSLTFALGANSASAQITPDATLPNNSTVTINGNTFNITGGTTRAGNLFHSFQQFSVPNGNTASFNNAVNIQNIFSRVTGGSPSNIDGIIKANAPANLFLINPNGIVFGPNARLDVGGSFLGSTANSLIFENGFKFSATDPQAPPLLTINIPIGLGFGNNPQNITSQSAVLRVQNGKSLALVGGNVNLNGGELVAEGGRIELGGLSTAGTVGLNTDRSLNFPVGVQRADISLTNRARVIVTSGDVNISASSLRLSGGAVVSAATFGADKGGNLSVDAQDVQLIGTIADGQSSSGLFASAFSNSTGNAGDLTIKTNTLLVRDGAQVVAGTFGAGKGGNLRVDAQDVQLIGTSADGQFPSGLFTSAFSNSTGNAGDLTIKTNTLLVRDGAEVSAGTSGAGKGGNLRVDAQDVQLIGTSADGQFPSGLFTSAFSNSTGNAGDLTIKTNTLLVRDGAEVSAGTSGAGKGGNLRVDAQDVQLIGTSADGQTSSGLFASANSNSTGNAGDLTIKTNTLLVRDGAEGTVSNLGRGNAGNLQVNADYFILNNQGKLTANSVTGNGGNTELKVKDILLMRRSSLISNTSGTPQAGGNGGNFTLNTKFLVAPSNDNNDIITNAFSGPGGKINIFASGGIYGFVLPSQLDFERFRANDFNPRNLPTNDIVAISQANPIISTSVYPINGLVSLPVDVFDLSKQITQGCSAFDQANASDFQVAGRGGLPPSPDEPLSSDAVWEDTRLTATTPQRLDSKTTATKPKSESDTVEIIPATGWVFNGKGEVTLVSQTPNATVENLAGSSQSCRFR